MKQQEQETVLFRHHKNGAITRMSIGPAETLMRKGRGQILLMEPPAGVDVNEEPTEEENSHGEK